MKKGRFIKPAFLNIRPISDPSAENTPVFYNNIFFNLLLLKSRIFSPLISKVDVT
jgi:hypothetical protein